jgi:hypothetical protein
LGVALPDGILGTSAAPAPSHIASLAASLL